MAFDVINLGALPATISNYWHGFRTERVTVDFLGAPCTRPLTYDVKTESVPIV